MNPPPLKTGQRPPLRTVVLLFLSMTGGFFVLSYLQRASVESAPEQVWEDPSVLEHVRIGAQARKAREMIAEVRKANEMISGGPPPKEEEPSPIAKANPLRAKQWQRKEFEEWLQKKNKQQIKAELGPPDASSGGAWTYRGMRILNPDTEKFDTQVTLTYSTIVGSFGGSWKVATSR